MMKKVVFLFLAIIIGAWNLFPVGAADPAAMRPLQHITVASGDTLWRIAERTAGNDEDIRQVVRTICQVNHLNEAAYLTPGQQLLIPVR